MKKEIRNYEENKISHTAWSDQPDRSNWRRQHIRLPDEYKDPTVHMADDSQDAWVFAKIVNENPELTITYASDWVDVTDAYKTAQNLNDIDYKVYAKKDVISKSAHSTIFEEVTVGNNVTEDTTFTDIKVSACAVQAAGFENYTDALAQVSFN